MPNHTQPTAAEDFGTCQACKQQYRLTKAGKIFAHGPDKARCKGMLSASRISDAGSKRPNHRNAGRDKRKDIPKRIPKREVHRCAELLADTLSAINSNPSSLENWNRLRSWAETNIGKGDKGIRHTEGPRLIAQSRLLAKTISYRIDAGDIKGAMRSVVDNSPNITPSEEILEVLKLKHPERKKAEETPVWNDSPALEATKAAVLKALHLMPGGSSHGPDQLRPSHLKQMCSPLAAGSEESLAKALTEFTNICLDGKVPRETRPHFFGCRLLAFAKQRRRRAADRNREYTPSTGLKSCMRAHISKSGCSAIAGTTGSRCERRVRGGGSQCSQLSGS